MTRQYSDQGYHAEVRAREASPAQRVRSNAVVIREIRHSQTLSTSETILGSV